MKRQHTESGAVRKICTAFLEVRTFELAVGGHRRRAKQEKAEMEVQDEEQGRSKVGVR